MILCYGDALLDVIVEPSRSLVPDDDVPAHTTITPGGQAANVAAWVAALGDRAALITRLGDDAGGGWLRGELQRRGVVVRSPSRPGRTGTVVSVVGGGTRTMASDRGDGRDLQASDLVPGWFDEATWLHISGYALFHTAWPSGAVAAAALARRVGAPVSVDLASAVLVTALGRAQVAERLTAVGAVLVFANRAEAAAADVEAETVVIKLGAEGAEVRAGGRTSRIPPLPPQGPARDTTGAGDAFAAGWLVGGAALAVAAASRCVSGPGAAPAQ